MGIAQYYHRIHLIRNSHINSLIYFQREFFVNEQFVKGLEQFDGIALKRTVAKNSTGHLFTTLSYFLQLFVMSFGPLYFLFKIREISLDWNIILPRLN